METLVFDSALGSCALARSGEVVQALTFGHRNQRAAVAALAARVAHSLVDDARSAILARAEFVTGADDALVSRLCAAAQGEPDDFADVVLDFDGMTAFQRNVSHACREIPWGETRTYGALADSVGRPGAARAVGSVMSQNCVPLIVPCHRVVPASGGLGGFSAPQGVAMKQRLLSLEARSALLVAGPA